MQMHDHNLTECVRTDELCKERVDRVRDVHPAPTMRVVKVALHCSAGASALSKSRGHRTSHETREMSNGCAPRCPDFKFLLHKFLRALRQQAKRVSA